MVARSACSDASHGRHVFIGRPSPIRHTLLQHRAPVRLAARLRHFSWFDTRRDPGTRAASLTRFALERLSFAGHPAVRIFVRSRLGPPFPAQRSVHFILPTSARTSRFQRDGFSTRLPAFSARRSCLRPAHRIQCDAPSVFLTLSFFILPANGQQDTNQHTSQAVPNQIQQNKSQQPNKTLVPTAAWLPA